MKPWRRLLFTGIAAVLAVWQAPRLMPIPQALLQPVTPSLEFTDRRGETLREVRVEERFAREAKLSDVPDALIHAILAAEDKRFYQHAGIDWRRLARAALSNVQRRRVVSGASTITQQLVKIADPRPRTVWTKIIEGLTARRLEQLWMKDEILAAYLNRVDFGNLNIGIASAARYYFDKPLSDLTHAEAAFLAGLPRGPARLNPHRHLPAAKRRQGVVLRRMLEAGWLTPEQYSRASAEVLALQPPRRIFRAPHFVDLILRGGTRAGTVQTTLDLHVQGEAERIVRERLQPLRAQGVGNAAVVVIENRTGDVLALVGSENFFAPVAGQVNGAWAPRSAGSTLKPFTYLLALERGATPATVFADIPASFHTSTGVYRPVNFNHRCRGPVRMRVALANSLNIPAVRALAAFGGAAALRERLMQWGIGTLSRPAEEYGLGLTIGNAEVRLLELTNAYAALARLGRYQPFRLTADAEGSSGAVTAHPSAAWLIADMLSDNDARALAFGRYSPLRFDFPVACKTGTSTDFRDNWAMGYTPEFTVGVWVGNFDGRPMQEVSGVTGAGPILQDVFQYLHREFGTTWYARPAEIVERGIHPLTGKLTQRPDAIPEKFVRGSLPEAESPACYDDAGRIWLGPEYGEWFASAENTLRDVAAVRANEELRVIAPAPGTTFVIDPDLPSSAKIPLLARSAGTVVWESATLECGMEAERAFARAAEGRHQLRARDLSTGKTAETWVTVRAL